MVAVGDEDTPFVFLCILSDDDFEIKSKYYSFIIVSSCFDSYLGYDKNTLTMHRGGGGSYGIFWLASFVTITAL